MPNVFKIKSDNIDKVSFDEKISKIDSVFITNELIYKDTGTKLCCFNHILLQIKDGVNLSDMLMRCEIPYLSYEKFGMCKNEYLLKLSVAEALYYANKLVETGYCVYAQPSFYRFKSFNNTLYPLQWGLKNTGQYSNSIVGIPVFFSSGNYIESTASSVKYPANLVSTIAVGAINYCGERIYRGNYLNHNCDGEHHQGSCYGFNAIC